MDTQKSIQRLVEEVLDELKVQGYSAACIKRYLATYRDLQVYADDRGIHEYSEAVGISYLDFRFGFKLEGLFGAVPQNISITLRHLLVLWHYKQYKTIMFVTKLKKRPFSCPKCFIEEYDAFLAYCQEKKYSAGGLDVILDPLRRFLLYLENRRVMHMGDINAAHISEFMSIYIDHSQTYIAMIIFALRTFLKYLHSEGYLEQRAWELLPKVRRVRNAFSPSSWKKEDVIRLLKAVDRGNPRGKRDYAILLLVVRLGLRAGDIRNLQLSNLDWNRKKIVIIQSKNKKVLELPILNDIGWALIDYLRNGRPTTRATTVFVKQRPPYSEFNDKNRMQHVVYKYMRLTYTRTKSKSLDSLTSTALITELGRERFPRKSWKPSIMAMSLIRRIFANYV